MNKSIVVRGCLVMAPLLLGSMVMADSQCTLAAQLKGPDGMASYQIVGTFKVNSQTGVFENLSFMSSGHSGPVSASGATDGSVGLLSLSFVDMGIEFNPKTNTVFHADVYGISQSILGSQVRCTPPLQALSCGQYVTDLYKDLLGRKPDPQGYAAWTQACQSGSLTRDQIKAGFYSSQESISQIASGFPYTCGLFVRTMYNEFLHRDPDTTGLQHWGSMCSAANIPAIVSGFINSAEYKQTH